MHNSVAGGFMHKRGKSDFSEGSRRSLQRNGLTCSRRRPKRFYPRSHNGKTPEHAKNKQTSRVNRANEQNRTRIRRNQKIPRGPGVAHVSAWKNQSPHVLHRRNRPQNNRLPPTLQGRNHPRNRGVRENKPLARTEQAEENPEKLQKTERKTHNRLLRRRKIWKKESVVDKRRDKSRIKLAISLSFEKCYSV